MSKLSGVVLLATAAVLNAFSIRTLSSTNTQTQTFSVPLITERAQPANLWASLQRLWNDPRPAASLIGDAISSNNNDKDSGDEIPYCIVSDSFPCGSHDFEILLYPRGRFATSQDLVGPAAAYLRYNPQQYGDEVDVTWKLKLVDTRTGNALDIKTSGGLPLSQETWSGAMTFCAEREAIESIGRVADWGSSVWYAPQVCEALGHIEAQGEITIHDSRQGESSFAFPPRGALRAVWDSTIMAARASQKQSQNERTFRAGEVIVPMERPLDSHSREDQHILEKSFILPGTDYRIMTMTDKDGNPIFSTDSLPPNERSQARLALRPCGWKLQQQLWQSRGMKTEWPVEVQAGLLSSSALTRFNPATSYPRIASTFQRDKTAVLLGVLLALAPLPGALIGRNFVSFYAIPSASMDPTLRKGDVLLVEKFPNVYDRTARGDVVLFQPPSSLLDIVGPSAIRGNSLFVKRVVGLPGDKDIRVNRDTQEVTIEGHGVVGPDRGLCGEEPLRLIDRLLADGKGTQIDELGDEDLYVVGDCKTVSVDSRVFGVLPKTNLAGKPVARIWPLDRFTMRPL